MSKNSLYKLKKSKEILLQTFRRYKRKKNTLLVNDTEEIKTALLELQERILEEDRRGADESAKQVETLAKIFLPKSSVLKFVNFIGALLFALFVAVLVRSMLIEPYEIPSGSMRPTLQEQDRLVVTKSDFGINIPLLPKHFYFDPSLVKRAATFIFTGANMDIHDVNTMYFYLFPGKKQFVKRMMGKPGDTLYFYGGRMYGINKDGLDISKELQPSSLDHINHVPFIHLDGKVIANKKLSDGIFSPIYFAQMNKQIAKMEITPFHTIKTELLTKKSNPLIKHYFDLWGFKNYAVARLLAANDLDSSSTISGDASLYLELIHHPNLENAKIERDPYGRVRPSLGYNKSII
ncbi:MAG: signal peptidase I, partial [Simkaniaceae bacterium]|nr:signal peptidase I [Simkaniaceae bacterium]